MELLIRIVNRGNGGKGDSLAGDVITAQPDGFKWGSAELTSPEWRIVRVGLTQAECDGLLTSVLAATLADVLVRRKYKVDFTLLPTNLKNWLAGARTKGGIIDAATSAGLIAVRAAVVLKT